MWRVRFAGWLVRGRSLSLPLIDSCQNSRNATLIDPSTATCRGLGTMAHFSDLSDFVQRLPKTETHLHLEGSLPLDLAQRIDPVAFAGPPPYWRDDYRFDGFALFQEQFDRYFFKWFISPENYFESCRRVFA